MNKWSVVFLGTPDFACESLKALVQSNSFNVVGVVSQPDRRSGRKMKLTPSPVKKQAMDYGLPVIDPENVNEALREVKAMGAQAAVVVAFGQILSQDFLDMFPEMVVKVHAAILPRWR
jgi:methionyl-tRNA formyltransferase